MIKVLQPFFDGGKTYYAGLEVADDPALKWAEARGLVERIEEKPEAKVADKAETPAKKATTTKKSTKK